MLSTGETLSDILSIMYNDNIRENLLRKIFKVFCTYVSLLFLKLVIRLREKYFGKSYFFPKILNFYQIGLPLAA